MSAFLNNKQHLLRKGEDQKRCYMEYVSCTGDATLPPDSDWLYQACPDNFVEFEIEFIPSANNYGSETVIETLMLDKFISDYETYIAPIFQYKNLKSNSKHEARKCLLKDRCYELRISGGDVHFNASIGNSSFAGEKSSYFCTGKATLTSANDWAYNRVKLHKVWSELNYTGRGIRIRINDPDGVDPDNIAFEGRFDKENSCRIYSPQDGKDDHGNIVAGIAAGAANNGNCARGIATESIISSCHVSSVDDTEIFNSEVESIDISHNSWGYDISQNSWGAK